MRIMNKKTVFIKTAKCEEEGSNLSFDLKRALSLIDNKSTLDELTKRAPPSLRDELPGVLDELVNGGFIRDRDNSRPEGKTAGPKITAPKMFVPKPVAPHFGEELDFTGAGGSTHFGTVGSDAKQKAELVARARAELEAAVAAAKAKSNAEAMAKAEAQARLEAEKATRAKAVAEANAAAEALAKQKSQMREQEDIQARAAQDIAARQRAAQSATTQMDATARAKADAEARIRAEIETVVRAKQNAELQAKRDIEAVQQKAEQESELIKAALMAAAKAKEAAEAEATRAAKAREEAEAEAARARAELEEVKARIEAEAKSKIEAEAARIKAEQQAAAQARAEAEAKAKAKAKAEAEAIARAAAESRAKAEAEAKAKAKAEAEARAKAEAEAKAKAEAEARAKAEMLARLRAEAEAKAKVEAEAKAQAEAAAKAQAEAAAKAKAEAATKAKAEAAASLRAEAEARAKAEAEARVKAEAEARARTEAQARVKAESETSNMDPVARARAEKDRAAEEEAAMLLAEYAHLFVDSKPKRDGAAKPASTPTPQPAPTPASAPAQVAPAPIAPAPVAPKPASAPAAFEIKLDSFIDASAARTGIDAGAKARQEESQQRSVAEMARLKSEAVTGRQQAEADARKQEEEKALAEEQAKAWAEAEQRAQTQARIEAAQVAQQAVMSQAKSTMKSAPRARRQPLPVAKISFGLIFLALLTGIALPYFYPMQEFVAPIEQLLSAQLKQPVHIGGLSAASLPPRLKMREVTIGKSQQVKIGEAELEFELLTLISDIKVIGSAELRNISIDGSQLDTQMASLKSLGGDRQFPVRHLELKNLKVVTDEIAVPGLSGIADIDEQGKFSRVSLHSEDNKFGIDLQPENGRWQLNLSLRETSLPFLPDIVFSDLSAKGELGDGEINFTNMDAHIFDGILLGSAKLKWNKGWLLQGQLEAKLFVLKNMFPKYGIEGEMYGQGTFSFSSAKLARLGDSPHLDASFTAKRGVISAIDLVETARLGSREHLVGGRTYFDDLIGTVQLDNHITHFRQMRVVSNMLSAKGSFDVLQDNKLSGNFNTEIKMRDGDSILTLYGTLAEPKLRAGR